MERRQRTNVVQDYNANIETIFYICKKNNKFFYNYFRYGDFARTREARTHALHIGDASYLGATRYCAIKEVIKRNSPARQRLGLLSEPKAKAAGHQRRYAALNGDSQYFTFVNYRCKISMTIKPTDNSAKQ